MARPVSARRARGSRRDRAGRPCRMTTCQLPRSNGCAGAPESPLTLPCFDFVSDGTAGGAPWQQRLSRGRRSDGSGHQPAKTQRLGRARVLDGAKRAVGPSSQPSGDKWLTSLSVHARSVARAECGGRGGVITPRDLANCGLSNQARSTDGADVHAGVIDGARPLPMPRKIGGASTRLDDPGGCWGSASGRARRRRGRRCCVDRSGGRRQSLAGAIRAGHRQRARSLNTTRTRSTTSTSAVIS